MSRRRQHVHKRQLWPVWRVAVCGALLGLAAGIVGTGIARFIVMPLDGAWRWPAGVTVVAVLWGLPAVTQLIWHDRLRYGTHSMLLGGSYGVLLAASIAPSNALWWGLACGRFSWRQLAYADLVMTCVVGGAVGTTLIAVSWVVSRRARGPLRVLDGTRCPACAYELIGCSGDVCPECGEPFTSREMLPGSEPASL